MIQTTSQDAYKSCEFLNILAGKRVGSSCKAFKYLMKQRDSFIALSHNKLESKTLTLSGLINKKCNSAASIENTKTDVKMISTPKMNIGLDLNESIELKENGIEKKIANDPTKTTKFNYELQVTTLVIYRPIIFLHLNRIVFTTPSTHLNCDVNENKILNSYLDKTAAKGNVEKLPVANCESLMMSEEKNNEKSFAERVKKYKKNPSFIKAYIEKTKFKGSDANKSRKVTFAQYVEVIEYVKLDYKVPLYNYEYDLK